MFEIEHITLNPAAWSSWSTNQWRAITVAVRPA
jgi:hypothetical protein